MDEKTLSMVLASSKSEEQEEFKMAIIDMVTTKDDEKTSDYTVVKRDGRLVPFRKERIERAIEYAFRDTKKARKRNPTPRRHQANS